MKLDWLSKNNALNSTLYLFLLSIVSSHFCSFPSFFVIFYSSASVLLLLFFSWSVFVYNNHMQRYSQTRQRNKPRNYGEVSQREVVFTYSVFAVCWKLDSADGDKSDHNQPFCFLHHKREHREGILYCLMYIICNMSGHITRRYHIPQQHAERLERRRFNQSKHLKFLCEFFATSVDDHQEVLHVSELY